MQMPETMCPIRVSHANRARGEVMTPNRRTDIDMKQQDYLLEQKRRAAVAEEEKRLYAEALFPRVTKSRALSMLIVEASRYQTQFYAPDGSATERLLSARRLTERPECGPIPHRGPMSYLMLHPHAVRLLMHDIQLLLAPTWEEDMTQSVLSQLLSLRLFCPSTFAVPTMVQI